MLKAKSFRRWVVILALVLGIHNHHGIAAQEGTPAPDGVLAFEIYPKGQILGDYFALTIEPGKTTKATVVLANTGTLPFEGRAYAVNAFSAVNGGFAVAESGTPPEGVTTWLDFPEEVYTIEPGTGIERTFAITVPRGTSPGQYLTALALENAEPRPVEGSENFQQVIRFPVPVFITVPGPVEPEFEIGQVVLTAEENASLIDIQIVNTGNVRVRPKGTVVVSDATGTQLFSVPVTMGSVYAHDTTSLLVNLSQPLGQGEYRVAVDLTDPETRATATGEATVTATAAATPVPPPPVQIVQATGTPQPDADDVQFLDVTATIENAGEPLTNVQVTLRVTKDGESVEDFPLATSLGVPTGQTRIQERYIPVTGWEAGTWAFTLSVEAVNAGTGVAHVLTTVELDGLVIA